MRIFRVFYEKSQKMDDKKNIKNDYSQGYVARRNVFIKNLVTILVFCVVYMLICRFTDIRIPCIFHKLTHLKCPGCGMTRAIINCTHFRFREAFEENMLLFIVCPPLMIIVLISEIRYIRTNSIKMTIPELVVLVLLFIVTICYTVIRNI